MRLLDIGCGPGSITAGLAAAVAPGHAIGVDLDPPARPTDAVSAVSGDCYRLPFADASFDAVFCCAMLQHLPDPLGALVEARRVCRPGAVIGVADCDWDGSLLAPTNELLLRAGEVRDALRSGTSPRVGKHLRGLLAVAGFTDAEAWVRVAPSPPSSAVAAAWEASFFGSAEVIAEVERRGISTAEEMRAITSAWTAWGDDPGAFRVGFWVEALAFA